MRVSLHGAEQEADVVPPKENLHGSMMLHVLTELLLMFLLMRIRILARRSMILSVIRGNQVGLKSEVRASHHLLLRQRMPLRVELAAVCSEILSLTRIFQIFMM